MSEWKAFMEGKSVKGDKRRFFRKSTEKVAKGLLKGWIPCTIIDFSREGMGVKFQSKEEITVGSVIYLEITVYRELKTLNLKGTIKWIKAESGGSYVGGIELDKPLKKLHHFQLSGKLAYTPPERVQVRY